MKHVLIIGDNMIDNLRVKSTETTRYQVKVCINTTALEVGESKLFSYLVEKITTKDWIVICFGTIDLLLGDKMFDVLKNVLYLYTVAKQHTDNVIVMSSLDRFYDYNMEIFMRVKITCNIISQLEERHFDTRYPNSRGRKKILHAIKKIIRQHKHI